MINCWMMIFDYTSTEFRLAAAMEMQALSAAIMYDPSLAIVLRQWLDELR